MLKGEFLFEEFKKENEERPLLVYIAHPMKGDIAGNKKKVIDICREIGKNPMVIPFTPYLSAFEYLDDDDPIQREKGMVMNRFYFERKIIDVLLICGDRMSMGVRSEIKLALENGIRLAVLDESRKEEVEKVVGEVLNEILEERLTKSRLPH